MSFDVQNKVAIITGGASGLGFHFARELLINGLRNVTIVDVNESLGKKSEKELRDEFGSDKALFVKADVAIDQEFEEAFKATLKQFKNIDILINNAAIVNEPLWSRVIDVNLKGVIRGTLLGLDYLSKYKTADTGVIVNIASIAALTVFPGIPFYTTAKIGVIQASRCLGDTAHYNRTKVRVIAVCPGGTNTSLFHEGLHRMYSPDFQEILDKQLEITPFPMQEPDHVSKSLIGLLKNASTGSVWVVENGEDAFELEFPERLGTKKQ